MSIISIITPDIPTDLVGTRRAAAVAGVHYSTIIAWIERGLVRGWRRPDGSYRVSAAEVRACALVPVVPRGERPDVRAPDAEGAARAAAATERLRRKGCRV